MQRGARFIPFGAVYGDRKNYDRYIFQASCQQVSPEQYEWGHAACAHPVTNATIEVQHFSSEAVSEWRVSLTQNRRGKKIYIRPFILA